MGDMAEDFKFLKEVSKKKRESNRNSSLAFLERADIPFEIKNGGSHLIVEGCNGFIDFWPGAGKWIARTGIKGFGVKNLIETIRKNKV